MSPPEFHYGAQPPPAGFGGRDLAGFWVRVGSTLLDWLLYGLLYLPFLVVGVVLIAVGFEDCQTIDDELVCFTESGDPDWAPIAIGAAVLVVGALFVALIYLRSLGRSGQTWGRKIAGVRVVREESDAPLGFGKALLRQFIQGLVSGTLFGLGYLWMLWDDKKQCWHDKIAGTQVIRV